MMKKDGSIHRKNCWFLLSAIFLTSFSLIAFEITLSRLLSVLLSYHYVFVVLSVALLGLGLGGMFVQLFRPKIPPEENRFGVLAFLTSLYSLTIPFSVVSIIQAGYIDYVQMNILFYGFLLLIPFFLSGVLLAEIYRMFPTLSGRIYGVDLIGAAVGSFGAILFLNIFGGMSANFILGVIASLAAVFFSMAGTNKKGLLISLMSCLILSALLGMNWMGFYLPEIPIGKNPAKEIHDALSSLKGKVIETKWSAFGRTDLVEFIDYPHHMDIYIDGTAGSPMYRFGGNANHPGPPIDKLKTTFPGYFPFHYLREEAKNDALLIGPGGGRDILLALMGSVQKITAVEINRDLVDLVRKYSQYNGGIYTDFNNVKIVVDEGRNFLRRQKERYDIIMLSLPVTNTSRSLEGYALTENFLFTTDSISNYLDHLTEEGQLVVVGHNDAEILRLLSISLVALNRRGVGQIQAMNHIYIVGSDDYLAFILQKTPLEKEEVLRMYQTMHQFGLKSTLSYFPYIHQVGTLNPALMALGSGKIGLNDLIKMVKGRGYDISPVTDNSPFFYKFEVGLPKPVSLVFWSSMILTMFVAFIPLMFWRKGAVQPEDHSKDGRYFDKNLLKSTILFSMLGLGFMVIEICFIQRFVLFLGYPVLSLAVLLSALLGGAGMGSLWSGQFAPGKINRVIAMTSLSIVVMVLGYTVFLPIAFDQLLGFDLTIRLLATIFILIPLGFLMGVPFPLGIRWLKERRLENHIPWMWGMNGVSSVLGSVMTIVVAISFGFTEALLVCAVCYFIVFLIFLKS